MKLVLLVGAAIMDDRKVLLLKRLETKKFLPGYYDLPGGKVEEGEDPNTAILRELKEETGMIGSVIRPYNIWHSVVEIAGNKEHIVEIDYLLKVENPEKVIISPDEHSEYIWVDKHNIPLKLSPELKSTIVKAFESNK